MTDECTGRNEGLTRQVSSGLAAGDQIDGPAWLRETVLGKNFVVERLLGVGGMGKVYLVRDRTRGEQYAVKRPKVSAKANYPKYRQFLWELQTWVDLSDHPSLVGLKFFRTLPDGMAIFAEYVPGGSLADWIRDGRLADCYKTIAEGPYPRRRIDVARGDSPTAWRRRTIEDAVWEDFREMLRPPLRALGVSEDHMAHIIPPQGQTFLSCGISDIIAFSELLTAIEAPSYRHAEGRSRQPWVSRARRFERVSMLVFLMASLSRSV